MLNWVRSVAFQLGAVSEAQVVLCLAVGMGCRSSSASRTSELWTEGVFGTEEQFCVLESLCQGRGRALFVPVCVDIPGAVTEQTSVNADVVSFGGLSLIFVVD